MNTNAETEYAPTGDYSRPSLDCDLVMKGGITSGVIYPLAICKLAERYRLHSIGGASAGAIAAAAAAAAEYARQEKRLDGYAKLQRLPDEIAAETPSGRTRLISLFQPTRATQTAFDAVLIAISKSSVAAKIFAFAFLVMRRHALFPLLGAAIAIALLLTGPTGLWQTLAIGAAALLALAAGLVGGAVMTGIGAYRSIAANGGGMCSGHAEHHPDGEPALCEWLADLIDDTAGKPHESPLTFGDLRKHDIELAMMTTNLSHGRPYRLPFADDAGFFFKKSEIRAMFPARIAKVLEDAGYASLNTGSAELRLMFESNGGKDGDFVPLPPGHALPVVFGVRLSLSFPVLLSAVPLYAVDWTSVRHPQLDKLPAEQLQTWRPKANAELPPAGPPYVLSRCWFSDGGICSNLPIHFFDSLLPRRPTFALNLRAEHPLFKVWTPASEKHGSELDNVWIPESPNAGFAESWDRVGSPMGSLGIAQLLKAMVVTMQNWNDNMLAKAPGYRDRVIHISHRSDEGGLNLDMPRSRIERLSLRGAAAGLKIGKRFDRTIADGWQNHLWVRYRSALGMLQSLLSTAHQRYFSSDPGKTELKTLITAPPSFPFRNPQETEAAFDANQVFGAFSRFDPTSVNFAEGAPRPITDLRPRPRGG